MRKYLLRGSVFVLLSFILGFSVHALLRPGALPPAVADCRDEPCATPPCCNGGVNGDGMIDIADAVYLLDYLFADGEVPEVIGTRLPQTGQNGCYDNQGHLIDCTSDQFPGQDGFYQSGCPNEQRFIANGDGTITDTCTGLMWQKRPWDYNGDGVIDYDDGVDWKKALGYCHGLELGGYSDWKLPNVRELLSIVDYSRSSPAVNPIFWDSDHNFWSSTHKKSAFSHDYFWRVDFDNGRAGTARAGGTFAVRAVHRIQLNTKPPLLPVNP